MQDRSSLEPGVQQNWEVCDPSGLNMIVLYAPDASSARARAAELLQVPVERLRAKALASHSPDFREHDEPALYSGSSLFAP
jgi:hypothetical protein